MKARSRRFDSALAVLLSLYLAAVTLTIDPTPPSSLAVAIAWESGEARAPVGPLGEVVGRLALWSLGPWLRWLLPLLPLAWLRWARGTARGPALRRTAWTLAGLGALAGILAHEAWNRVGLSPGGGALGDRVEMSLARVVGPLGSFLVLAGLSAHVLLRLVPPIRVPMPAFDAAIGGLRKRLPGWGFVGSGWSAVWRGMAGGARWLRDQITDQMDRWRSSPEEPASEAGPEPGPAGHSDLEGALRRQSRALAPEAAESVGRFELPAAEEEPLPALAQAAAPADASAASAPELFRLSRDPQELLREAKPSGSGGRARRRRGDFPLPSIDLLDNVIKEERGFSRDVLQMKARLLMETLSHYGIDGRINEIRPGPVVTTFEFEPAPGVKVSQITSRADDLALAMRATRIRIEAPIPGKAAVGIEIPNPFPQTVSLKEVVRSVPDGGESPLTIALGKTTEGDPHFADLSDMPHLLVAGATGSGKSVCMNSLICNLLLRNGPDRVRLLMVDPKMLELSVYNGIPHLLHPVITDAREALKAIKWMVAEMNTRYSRLAKHGVRNIADYNTKIKEGKARDANGEKIQDTMPYYVVIIDELADLMMTLGQDLETPIARLAQMARAVGIHLVLATQRPSVNVITGIIKANFPSRIAFRVVSKVDSRTILDCMGAEQLLGKGDMLFLPGGMPQPVRVHGAFLTIEECERVVEHWAEFSDEDATLPLDEPANGMSVDLGEDDLLDDARRLVVMTQMGSTSMLQRRLRVGYTRAARLMDMLEESGVVGPFEGSKAREVLVPREELEAEG